MPWPPFLGPFVGLPLVEEVCASKAPLGGG